MHSTHDKSCLANCYVNGNTYFRLAENSSICVVSLWGQIFIFFVVLVLYRPCFLADVYCKLT